MKSFDNIINGKVNENSADKWRAYVGKNEMGISENVLFRMLLDIMEKLDEIDAKVTKYEGESSGEN